MISSWERGSSLCRWIRCSYELQKFMRKLATHAIWVLLIILHLTLCLISYKKSGCGAKSVCFKCLNGIFIFMGNCLVMTMKRKICHVIAISWSCQKLRQAPPLQWFLFASAGLVAVTISPAMNRCPIPESSGSSAHSYRQNYRFRGRVADTKVDVIVPLHNV